jgi:hypothetical protein
MAGRIVIPVWINKPKPGRPAYPNNYGFLLPVWLCLLGPLSMMWITISFQKNKSCCYKLGFNEL